MKRLFAICLFLLVCAAASAEDKWTIRGNQILDECKLFLSVGSMNTPVDAFKGGDCLGYIRGAVDTQEMWEKAEGTTSKVGHYCVPNYTTNGQLAKIVVKYLEDHPAELHQPAQYLVYNSLMGAFPCK